MADCSKKCSTTINSVIYFLIFSQLAINLTIAQNLFQNAQFEEQIATLFQKLQMNYKDQFINEPQAPFEDQLKEKSQGQYKPELPNIPNESPELSKENTRYDAKASSDDSERNPAQIPNNIQLLNNGLLPNIASMQYINNFLRSLTDVFPQLAANNNPSDLRDSMKRVQTSLAEDVEIGSELLARYILTLNISLECLTSLNDLQIGLKEGKIWAIRMVDSFGKIPNGILDGNLRSLGDFDMCLDTELPGKYRGMYCTVIMQATGKTEKRVPLTPSNLSFVFNRDFSQSIFENNEVLSYMGIPITTSICLPSNCSKPEVQSILTEVISYGYQSVKLGVHQCETKEELPMSRVQWNILCVMLVLLLFEVYATILDLRLRCFYGEKFHKIVLSKAVQCILAFSYYSNIIGLFKVNETSDSVKIFHGMKVISLSWIVVGHVLIIYLRSLGRLYQILSTWSGFLFQVFSNVHGPETFFFISGFLLMYSFIKANSSQVSFVYYALIRFFRLMPSVLFFIGCILLSENLSSGPMWKDYVTNILVEPCKTTWWRNLLFINNMIGFHNTCLPWSWYIAADMQLYLISYLILVLMKMNPQKAVLALKIIIIASVGGLAIYHAAYNLPPHPLLIYVHYVDRGYFTTMLHFRTYNHVTPYFLGQFTGYLIATNKKITLTRRRQFLGWFLAVIFTSVCLFTSYIWNHRGRPATVMESAIYGGTHRFLWCLMLAWVVYTCMNGKAGIVVSILSWERFAPLSRLTFMAYLIHPLLQLLFIGQLRFVIPSDTIVLLMISLCFIVVSYVLAIAASLICESPLIKLFKILFSSKFNKSNIKTKERIST